MASEQKNQDTSKAKDQNTSKTKNQTQHNFKITIDENKIPILIGKGGKNLFYKVILPSIKEFQKMHKASDSKVEYPDKIYKNIRIKETGIGVIASWNDTHELSNGNGNVTLNELIKKNLTDECKGIMEKKDEQKEKKYRQNFNFRIGLEDCSIGQFIGNGGETINEFKGTVSEELGVDNVFVKILMWEPEMIDMYRAIGFEEFNCGQEYFLFKVSFIGGERADILKVEKMLIDFVNINAQDDSVSNEDKENDLDNLED